MRETATNKMWWVGAMVAAVAIGCGRAPQISRPNQSLIDALRTAASARQAAWIDDCAKSLEERKQQGRISAEESKPLEAIIELARAGKWKEAEAEAKRLGKAQDLSGG